MPHLISNLVEKTFTPSFARLAPKHLTRRPTMGRKPQKIYQIGSSPLVRSFWRLTRRWICHNHKLYYSYVLICAWGMYQLYFALVVGYYRRRNYHRSLDYAIMREQEYQKNKPADDEDEEEEEEDAPAAEEED
mmetsp:Transcript_526/g.545  ORF Transcript_526/g.545 Transcript_526/m.545 type:complete len:133 (-) Transcript_526:62-460(-)